MKAMFFTYLRWGLRMPELPKCKIENITLPHSSVDVIISNYVVNLPADSEARVGEDFPIASMQFRVPRIANEEFCRRTIRADH